MACVGMAGGKAITPDLLFVCIAMHSIMPFIPQAHEMYSLVKMEILPSRVAGIERSVHID